MEDEIIFSVGRREDIPDIPQTHEIRRLSVEDRGIFNRHLGLCRQAEAGRKEGQEDSFHDKAVLRNRKIVIIT